MTAVTNSVWGCACYLPTCFKLAGKAEDLGVVWNEVWVQFTENEQLRSPVLSVKRSLLQLQQAVAGSL